MYLLHVFVYWIDHDVVAVSISTQAYVYVYIKRQLYSSCVRLSGTERQNSIKSSHIFCRVKIFSFLFGSLFHIIWWYWRNKIHSYIMLRTYSVLTSLTFIPQSNNTNNLIAIFVYVIIVYIYEFILSRHETCYVYSYIKVYGNKSHLAVELTCCCW